jgi:hypothetical protein
MQLEEQRRHHRVESRAAPACGLIQEPITLRIRTTLLWTILLLALTHGEANAYLDPATGSYVLQILAAAFFGALFALKMFWGSVKAFFGGLFRRPGDAEPNDD